MLFTGYISDDDRDMLYLAADVAVFPSLYEPFGIVALESMAAGTPVVVSDSGGLAEIVEHEVDGLHAITGSANSLADQLLRVLKNDILAKKLRENALRKVKTLYDWRVIADRTIEVYETVTRENTAGQRAAGRMPWTPPRAKRAGQRSKGVLS
jgi:glycosyltransferase involved in cell wall biosynthesis